MLTLADQAMLCINILETSMISALSEYHWKCQWKTRKEAQPISVIQMMISFVRRRKMSLTGIYTRTVKNSVIPKMAADTVSIAASVLERAFLTASNCWPPRFLLCDHFAQAAENTASSSAKNRAALKPTTNMPTQRTSFSQAAFSFGRRIRNHVRSLLFTYLLKPGLVLRAVVCHALTMQVQRF